MIVRRSFEFNAPRQTLVENLMERYIRDPAVMLNSPNLTGCKLLSHDDKGDTVDLTVQYSAYSQIPKVVQHLLTPDMLSWISYGRWDRRKMVYTFDVETMYFTKQVHCRGVQSYHAIDENRSVQKMEMKLRISIPLFSAFIEKEIARAFVSNIDSGYPMARKMVEEGYVPEGYDKPGPDTA